MLAFVAWLASLLAVVLALPAVWFVVEVVLALIARPTVRAARSDARYVVIVPAHDEESGLGDTLESLTNAVDEHGSVLVVADNCTDRTADVARAHGVTVLERHDTEHRGKGYALSYAVASLEQAPPAILVFVDADCLVEPDAIRALVDESAARNAPTQADYVLVDPDPSPRSAISTLAFLVRNRVRPLGLKSLGGPSGLFGTGMAMPYALFRELPAAEGHLVEDMWLGVECALRGRAPEFVPHARVTSAAAEGEANTRTQRTRWEHGHLSVLRRDVPRLLASGDGRALLLGLDLAIPPLALLVLAHAALGALGLLVALLTGSVATLMVATFSTIAIGLSVVLAWNRFGRASVPARALAAIPSYLLFKIPIYLGLMKQKETEWVRTDRAPREP